MTASPNITGPRVLTAVFRPDYSTNFRMFTRQQAIPAWPDQRVLTGDRPPPGLATLGPMTHLWAGTSGCPIFRPPRQAPPFGLDHHPTPGPCYRLARATSAIGRIATRRFAAALRLVQAEGHTVLVIRSPPRIGPATSRRA